MGVDSWHGLGLRGVFCCAGSGLRGLWTVRVVAHVVIVVEAGLVVVVLRFGSGCACSGLRCFVVRVVCSYFVFQVSSVVFCATWWHVFSDVRVVVFCFFFSGGFHNSVI